MDVTEQRFYENRLKLAEELLEKCGYMWVERACAYRSFNTCEAVAQDTVFWIILVQNKGEPKYVAPLTDPAEHYQVMFFTRIENARALRARLDKEYPNSKHHIIELPSTL